jgi:hypothetical protein
MKRLFLVKIVFYSFCLNAAPVTNSFDLNNVPSALPRKYQERLENYLRASPDKDGPNCFQATAFITGLTNRMTYMSDIEFFWLLKKFNCKELQKNDVPQSGDIGLLSSDFSKRNEMKHYEHAFVWDRFPDYLVEKIGSYSSFKLKQTHIRESEQWTLFKKECLIEPDKCALKLTNFRCPQYLAEKVYNGSNALEQQSRTVEEWLRSKHLPPKKDLSQLVLELKSLLSRNSEQINKQSNINLFESYSLENEEARSLLRQVQILMDPN